jgi:uncharacterized protein (TIGR03084 family)
MNTSAAPSPPPATAASVRDGLIAEQDALDAVVGHLDDELWALDTPSQRWTIADQIGHLTYFDWTASLAITDPDRFTALTAELMGAMTDAREDAMDLVTLGDYRAMTPHDLCHAWRTNRGVLSEASASLVDDDRVIWYGPSMGAKSFLTARLMEAWAHGQDIIDALDEAGIAHAERLATDRLRHIAQLGFITHKWSYINRQMDAPTAPVRVELAAPSGESWVFGLDDAADSITGPAVDFCLVTTQRRHVDDTALIVHGDVANDWMHIAQAFAGGATTGPAAGTFSNRSTS